MNPIDPIYVSCGLRALYDEKSFPGPKSECVLIKQRRAAGEYICELFPSYEYERPIELDNLYCGLTFAKTLATSRALVNSGPTGPASALFLLPRVIIRDRVIYLDDGSTYPVVYETHRPIDRANSSLASLDELQKAQLGIDGDGPTFFLGSTGCFNYGHWLVDDLSRLKAFWEIRKIHPDKQINIILAAHSDSIDMVRRQSIEFLLSEDRNFNIKMFPRPAAFSFNSIYYASPTTVHSTLKSPEAMNELRNSASTVISKHRLKLPQQDSFINSNKHKRLFVDRGPARSRNLQNGAEIFAMLQPYGFELHTLEEESFMDQVNVFSQASIVVGNMGAGMTNTIFCVPSTSILNLAPEGWDEPFFWDLATVMGHRHFAMYGSFNGKPFESSFGIDPAFVVDKIRHIAGQL